MSRACLPPPPLAPQTGMVLVSVAIVLATAMLLATSSAQLGVVSERAARNETEMQLAWQAAEAALHDAERELRGDSSRAALLRDAHTWTQQSRCGSGPSTAGVCPHRASGRPLWLDLDTSHSAHYGQFTQRPWSSSDALLPAPRYQIERLESPAPTPPSYRITAIGFGPRPSIQVVLQSVYRPPLEGDPPPATSAPSGRLSWRALYHLHELRGRAW